MDNRVVESELRSIVSQIILSAESDTYGTYWRTYFPYPKLTLNIGTSLYNGTSGILLFLLEYYSIYSDAETLKTINSGLAWIKSSSMKQKNMDISFMTGESGIAYLFLRAYQVLGIREYLLTSEAITLNNISRDTSSELNEFMSGVSGRLLCLLHLFNTSRNEQIFNEIIYLVKRIIKNSYFSPSGLSWDKSIHYRSPLCGFSHGVSGIVFVLLEVAHYFNFSSLEEIYLAASDYERSHLVAEERNWRDLRFLLTDDETLQYAKRQYRERNYNYFQENFFITAWCHGATGIGLSRGRAFELTNNLHYFDDLKISLDIVSKNWGAKTSATLCHGFGGDAELFQYAKNDLRIHDYENELQQMAEKCINIKNNEKYYLSGFNENIAGFEDLSLMNGIAGVGYFLLRYLHPDRVQSILLPTIRKKIIDNNIPEARLTYRLELDELLFPYYSKSLLLFKNFNVQINFDMTELKSIVKERSYETLKIFFQNYINNSSLHISTKNQLTDLLAYENRLHQFAEQTISHALLYVASLIDSENSVILLSEYDENFIFLSNPLSTCAISKWDWSCPDVYSNLGLEEGNFMTIFTFKPDLSIDEYMADGVEDLIYRLCQNGLNYRSLFIECLKLCPSLSIPQSWMIKVKESIRTMVVKRILIKDK